jgi:hypothetical protein
MKDEEEHKRWGGSEEEREKEPEKSCGQRSSGDGQLTTQKLDGNNDGKK